MSVLLRVTVKPIAPSDFAAILNIITTKEPISRRTRPKGSLITTDYTKWPTIFDENYAQVMSK